MSKIQLTISALFLFSVGSLKVIAQTGPLLNALDQSTADVTSLLYNRYGEISGSPYLNDEFTTGNVSLKNQAFDKLDLRYNIYDNSVELKKEDGSIVALSSNVVSSFDLLNKDKKRVKFELIAPNGYPRGFYQVLRSGGTMNLYKVHKVQLIKSGNTTEQTGYNASAQTPRDRFDYESFYLLTIEDGSVFKLDKMKSKELEKALSDYPKYANYFDNNKVKIKSETDMINVLGILETLK